MPVFEILRMEILGNDKSVPSDVNRYIEYKICSRAGVAKENTNRFVIESCRCANISIAPLSICCPTCDSGGIRASGEQRRRCRYWGRHTPRDNGFKIM